MHKDEILERGRNTHRDEGQESAESQGLQIGFIIFTLLFAFLAIFNLFFGEAATFYAMSSLFWTFMAAMAYGRYRFSKSKIHLVTMIAGSITSIAFVANYIMLTLR